MLCALRAVCCAVLMPGCARLAALRCPRAALLAGRAQAHGVCLATTLFLQLAACVIGPTLLSVYSWADPGPPAPYLPRHWRQLCCFWMERAEHGASRALCWLLHNPAGGVVSRLIVAWWLLAATWFCCKRLAGLP